MANKNFCMLDVKKERGSFQNEDRTDPGASAVPYFAAS